MAGIADPRRKDAIWTYTGRVVRPLEPSPRDIGLIDIAHSLSNLCRFTGHVREFYCVAQHSVLVSDLLWALGCDPEVCLWGLLHDAPEAYLWDLSRPVKKAEEIEGVFAPIEERLMEAISEHFQLRPSEMPEIVHEADRALGRAESLALMPDNFNMGSWGPRPSISWAVPIKPWSPREARSRFLARFEELS